MTGHLDYEAVIGQAWELRVRRYVTEMWDMGKDTWKEDIRFANKRMSRILEQQN